jgi:hypothetical protein
MMKTYGLMGVIALLSPLLALPARAEEPSQIFLSEINFAGSEASTADEWVEIVNAGKTTVDLTGWVVQGIGSAGSSIPLPEGTMLEPSHVFLIANYDAGAKSTLTVHPHVITSDVSIPNSDLQIKMVNAAGTIVDQYSDSGAADFGKSSPSISIERDFSTMSWRSATSSKNLTSTIQLATPGYAELFARPPVGTTPSAGPTPGSVPAPASIVPCQSPILAPQTSIQAQLQETATYDTTTNNASTTQSTPAPVQGTPATLNPVTGGEDAVWVEPVESAASVVATSPVTPSVNGGGAIPQVEIEELDTVKDGKEIIVQGTVVAEPGLFGKQLMYVNGLEIYFNKADWPELKTDTEVLLHGVLQKKEGYDRLKISKTTDVVILKEKIAEAEELSSLSEASHGQLVSVSGTLADKSGKNLTIELESGEKVKITPAKGLSLNLTDVVAGQNITASGILRIKGNESTVFLRTALDLILENEEEPADTDTSSTEITLAPAQGNIPWLGGGLLTTSLGALTFWFTRAKGISLPFIQ